jgi:hypothetical protein
MSAILDTPNDGGKRNGMDTVEANSNGWVREAAEVIGLIAEAAGRGARISNNDVTEAVVEVCGWPHHVNCWGPAWRKAASLGYVEATDRTVKSTMKASNAHRIAVWVSLVGDLSEVA